MHYSYNRDAGRYLFSEDVNRLFERNGIAFELREGEILRVAPAVLQEVLAVATLQRAMRTSMRCWNQRERSS